MRSNAVGGGGERKFKISVGRCSYDASTQYHQLVVFIRVSNFESAFFCLCAGGFKIV